MEFIVKRASQYNYLGDEEMTPPCPNGKWQEVTEYEYRTCTKEEATTKFRDNGHEWKDYTTRKDNKLGCFRVWGKSTMYTVSIKTIKELMSFIKELGSHVIIEEQHEYNLPVIIIYDDYIE